MNPLCCENTSVEYGMKYLAIIIVLSMALAIPVAVIYKEGSTVRTFDRGYQAVQIGDPEEVLTGLMAKEGVRRTRGQITGLSWVDDISARTDSPPGVASIYYRVKGLASTVIWEFEVDQDRRISNKRRLE